jgi:hypothetical protein
MELYLWSFDSIHSHCHEDGIILYSILKNFKEFWAIARYRAPPRHVIEKVAMSGTSPYEYYNDAQKKNTTVMGN